MELPRLLWDQKLADGTLFSEFVDRTEPTAMPLANATAFSSVWRERLVDSEVRNLPDLKAKAQRVLAFLSNHNTSLYLLMWPSYKITALFDQASDDFLLLD